MKHALLATVPLLLLAGCIGAQPQPSDQAQEQQRPETPQGTLLVHLDDASGEPIPGASVQTNSTHGERVATTDPGGTAHLEGLHPGLWMIQVRADGYEPAQRTVTIEPDTTTNATLTLQPTTATTTQRFEFNGFFECSATYLIITGDCFAPARAATQELGVGPEINASNHRFAFPFQLHEGWSTIRITQTWEDGALTAGSMMRINLEPDDPATREGHSPHYARAEGASPLTLTIDAQDEHPTASPDAPALPTETDAIRTRTFHLGMEETHNPAGTEFLGAGTAIQQPFTVLVEVTYP